MTIALVIAIVAVVGLCVYKLDRAEARHRAERAELYSRLQHPELIQHPVLPDVPMGGDGDEDDDEIALIGSVQETRRED